MLELNWYGLLELNETSLDAQWKLNEIFNLIWNELVIKLINFRMLV